MMTNNQQSSRLIIIAGIFAMSMLVLVSVAEVLNLFPDVEAREGKYSNDDKYGIPQIELTYFSEHWVYVGELSE